MFIEILIIFILIFLNGIFSMSEIALVSSKKYRLENKANEGHKGAGKALELSENPGKFLSTVQVGITLIGILTGVYGGASIAERMADYFQGSGILNTYAEPVATGIVVIFITYFTLIFGELIPKRLGLNAPEKISSFMALPMYRLASFAKPLVWLLNASTEVIIKIFRIKPNAENFVTEDEVRAMLEQATGVEEEEREMVERVFFLGDTDVGSLMTSRNDLVMLDINAPFDVYKEIISSSIHTNFPVYEDKPDNIIGILNLKSLTSALVKNEKVNEKVNVRAILTEPLFVTENTKAFKLLERMKESGTHFAVAVNEYGSVMGVITSNDLFKVIAGNLYKNKDKLEIIKRSDGSYLVDGLISLDEFFRYFEIEDTEDIENKGFYTLGGLVLYITNHIPSTAEKFTWRNLKFEILDMDGQRVDKVLVKVK